MRRGLTLVAPCLVAAAVVGACEAGDDQRHEAGPAEAPVAAASPAVVAEPPPPPPWRDPEPEWAEWLDAAMLGPVELPEGIAWALRRLQVDAGDRPVLATRDDVGELVDALLAAARELPAHGFVPSGLETSLVADVEMLRREISSSPDWTGDSAADGARARATVHLEGALAALFLRLAERHDAAGETTLETLRGARVRFLGALATWRHAPALIDSLPPASRPYDRLRAALPRYRALVAAGDFEAVPAGVAKARPGKRHPDVPALRRRLAQEDPLGAGEGDVWDDALTEALRRARDAYQLSRPRKTRQLLDKKLRSELARPAAARLAAVERNLIRLRRSDLRRHDYAVYVNLPDYHGEVWDGPERRLRFRTVIGNTTRSGGRMINATPRLTARMDRVVFNPWWNVPARIYKNELLKKAESFATERTEATAAGATPPADAPADYWEAKGYDVKNADNPAKTWVRRRPGPGNALGKVKFLFENRYFVFLHDTPQRRKFNSTRRAFSHGCMRVQNPILLAEEVLKRDGTWRVAEEAKVMKHYKETPIELAERVWVIVEYITARADDSGRVHFFADVYRRDGPEVAAR